MPLASFQGLCLAVLLAAYAVSVIASADRRRRVAEIGVLAVAAWLGEHTCIEAYRFYAYADGWWLRLGHVPLLVPLIWPMVVLSARDIVAALWPAGSAWRRALAVGAIVVFDASIMEVIAVAAGYWSWFEPGYFQVPLMGIVGWGCFGFVASWWLDRADAPAWWLWATPITTIVASHALLLACWWGGLRWVLRGDLGPAALAGYGVLSALYAVAVLRVRRRRSLSWWVTGPRILATSVFVVLLVVVDAAHTPWLWGHIGIAAVPYLLATSWQPPGRLVGRTAGQ